MATLAMVIIEFTGKSIICRSTIPVAARDLGVAPMKWTDVHRVSSGDITEYGASVVQEYLLTAGLRIGAELRGAWEQYPFF